MCLSTIQFGEPIITVIQTTIMLHVGVTVEYNLE